MKHFVWALILLWGISLPVGAAESRLIKEREVPTPAGASPELQSSIASTPAPNRAARLTYTTTEADLLKAQQNRNRVRAKQTADLARALDVQIDWQKIEGVAVAKLTPAVVAPTNEDKLFIYLHGGAYVYGAGDAGLAEGLVIANRLNMPVLAIDYRMPPAHPFPAAVNDVVRVYQHLLKSRPANSLVIGGTSAGGGLSLASVHKFRQLDLPTPAAVYGGTAWADLTKTGDSLYTNEGLDRILVTYDGSLEAAAKLYAGGHDLKDPLLSPVYGDFNNFPPVFLVTGTRDLFLSDVVRTHRRLRAAGVEADLHVYEGMSHAGYLVVANSPESLDMYQELRRFVERHVE